MKTVIEKYNRELEEIEDKIELYNSGEICDFQLMNKIKNLTICAYYDGKSEGLKEANKIYIFLAELTKEEQKKAINSL